MRIRHDCDLSIFLNEQEIEQLNPEGIDRALHDEFDGVVYYVLVGHNPKSNYLNVEPVASGEAIRQYWVRMNLCAFSDFQRDGRVGSRWGDGQKVWFYKEGYVLRD